MNIHLKHKLNKEFNLSISRVLNSDFLYLNN